MTELTDKEYLALLQQVSQMTVYRLRLSSDQAIERLARINVNLNSRVIELPPEYTSYFAVKGDRHSRTIYFRVPRFYDGVDLAKVCCVVEYINAKNEARIAPILLKDLDYEKNYIHLGWELGYEVASKAGKLKFALRFFVINQRLNEEGQKEAYFTYNMGTQPCTVTILPGIDATSLQENNDVELSTSLLTMWQILTELQENSTYWIDVLTDEETPNTETT